MIEVPRGEPPVIQHLYPFTEGGPVLYTPPHQTWIGSATREAPDGWFAAPSELITELEERGLPERSPLRVGKAGEQPAPTPEAGPSPVLLIVGIVVALVVAAAAAGRRRAAARPAHPAT